MAENERAVLSFAQERLWVLEQLAPTSTRYCVRMHYELSGPLNADALQRTISYLINRHEAFRTKFVQDEDGTLSPLIGSAANKNVEIRNVSDAPEPLDEARQILRTLADEGIEFLGDSLWSCVLIRVAPQKHFLHINVHHAVFDGLSQAILEDEISSAYRAICAGELPVLPPLRHSYLQYAAQQRDWADTEDFRERLTYWTDHLAGAPPTIELPISRPRPGVPIQRGGQMELALGDILGSLRALARRSHASIFTVILAAYAYVLAEWAGVSDAVIGIPVAGRPDADQARVIGLFANSVAIRASTREVRTFADLISQVSRNVINAIEYGDVPFERVVESLAAERDLSRNPVFQYWFDLTGNVVPGSRAGNLDLPSIDCSALPIPETVTRFDLEMQLRLVGNQLTGTVTYSADLFDESDVMRFARCFTRLLTSVLDQPDTPLSRLELTSEDERRRVLGLGTGKPALPGSDFTVSSRFRRQVQETPDAAAVRCEGIVLTYRDLEARAGRLAGALVRHGIGPESVVAICLPRGIDLVCAVLGVTLSGAAYLPVDPEQPPERIGYLAQDASASAFLTLDTWRTRLSPPGMDLVIAVDDPLQPGEPTAATQPRARPDNLLYIVYTSGSTGAPKGVAVTNRTAGNLVAWHLDRYKLGPGERVAQIANVSFDAAAWEIWPTLLSGARLDICPDTVIRSPADLADHLSLLGTTIAFAPTPLAEQLIREPLGSRTTLRCLLTGGDVFRPRRHDDPGIPVVDHYGPTENTVVATATDTLSAPWEHASIGRPIRGVRVYLIDRAGRLTPEGVPGELCLGGESVARGYLHRPGLTAQRFVPDPFSDRPGARMYRTGDLARWRADGTLAFLGRLDQQIKISGYRVEPAEIESVLLAHACVRQAAVQLSASPAGVPVLTAYVAGLEGDIPVEDLRAHVARHLPRYMVPAVIVPLRELPVSPSGKVDRRSLPAPAAASPPPSTPPRDATDRRVLGLVSEVLGLPKAGLQDDFFAIGGTSIAATSLLGKIKQAFGIEFPLRDVFEKRTVAALADAVRAAVRAGSSGRIPGEQARAEPLAGGPAGAAPRTGPDSSSRHDRTVLSFGQEGLWLIDQLTPGNAAYNFVDVLHLRGSLDVLALQRAVNHVIRCQDALRTRFEINHGEPSQIVMDAPEGLTPVTDLSTGPSALDRALEAVQELAETPFDLLHGPLFVARIYRLADEEHVLAIVVHHSVFDRRSYEIWKSEVTEAYTIFCSGKTPREQTRPVRYADYAVWQRGDEHGMVIDQQARFWTTWLENSSRVLELATDHERPSTPSYEAGIAKFGVEPTVARRLHRLARENRASLFMVGLAAYQVLLNRHSGATDLLVGCPMDGRTEAAFEPLIGYFVNSVPLRARLDGNPGFTSLIQRARDAVLEAHAHQCVPFERLVMDLGLPRDLSRNPLIQVWFDLEEAESPADSAGIAMTDVIARGLTTGHVRSRFDLELHMLASPGDCLTGRLIYAADLFESTTGDALARRYVNILNSVAEAPGARLSQIAMLSPEEKQQIMADWATADD